MSADAAVTLREVTRDNWEACIHLQLEEHQLGWVESNVESLAESRFYPTMLPQAIYAGEELVGFVVYSQAPDPRDPNYWVHRIMVDARQQGRGYGRAAMREVIRRLSAKPDCRSIWIAYSPDNHAAARLYASLGFEEQGQAPWGEERMARLILRE